MEVKSLSATEFKSIKYFECTFQIWIDSSRINDVESKNNYLHYPAPDIIEELRPCVAIRFLVVNKTLEDLNVLIFDKHGVPSNFELFKYKIDGDKIRLSNPYYFKMDTDDFSKVQIVKATYETIHEGARQYLISEASKKIDSLNRFLFIEKFEKYQTELEENEKPAKKGRVYFPIYAISGAAISFYDKKFMSPYCVLLVLGVLFLIYLELRIQLLKSTHDNYKER